MKRFICTVCGYVHEGDAPPASCPLCGVGPDKFIEQPGAVRRWADGHQIGGAKMGDPELADALRGMCRAAGTGVGSYLAMGRQAEREGLTEVAAAFRRLALEKADHAARLTELLGEALAEDTRTNLRARLDTEHAACKGKKDLANKAKQLDSDAIHDTVHEMCKDEARHGEILAGLLRRYFQE